MRKIILVAAVLAFSLMLSGAVLAMRDGPRGERGMRDLGLDKEQIEQLETMRMEHRLEMIDLRAEQRTLRLKMHMELRDGEPDQAELERMVEKIADVRERIAKRRLGHLLAARKILNDDQWEQFLRRHHGGMGGDEIGPARSRMHGTHGMMKRGGRMMHGPARGDRPARGVRRHCRRLDAESGREKI